MSSSLMSVARSALLTHQTSLQTISHNIANAETPGYSRQEAVITTNTPTRMAYGVVGNGVHVDSIIRRRDQFLDDSFRTADGLASGADMRRDLMGQVESVFGEPSDEGMSNALDAFWSGWSDLTSSPGSLSTRAIIQQRGRQAATLFNDYDTRLTQLRSTTLDRLQGSVATINVVAEQVADLNKQIAESELSGNTANDLRDLRDGKLDELAKLGGTRSFTQSNGSVTVLIGNATLVQGDSVQKLSLAYEVITPPPTTPVIDVKVRLQISKSPDLVIPLPSEIKAVMDVLNVDIPDTRSRLDALAANLVSAVNAVHTTGYTFTGNTVPGTAAGNFFAAGTPSIPVTASNIQLDSAVANDPFRIAASGSLNGPTDNSVAQRVAQLRLTENTVSWSSSTGATETGSFLGFYRSMVTRIGVDVAAADDNATVYQSLADQADSRRQAVSGVSTDEELVNMMRVQQSYQAATKMIKMADEMMQTLLSLV